MPTPLNFAEYLFYRQRMLLIARRVFPSADVWVDDRFDWRDGIQIELRVHGTKSYAERQYVSQMALSRVDKDEYFIRAIKQMCVAITRYMMEDSWQNA